MAAFIAANYASYFAGVGVLTGGIAGNLSITLDNAASVLWGLSAAFYMLTLVVEYPFAAYLFLGTRRGWGKALLATILVQTLSYVALAGLYDRAMRDDFIADGVVVSLESMPVADDVVVYFLDEHSDALYRQQHPEFWTLAWPNGADLAPEFLYERHHFQGSGCRL